jgi:hypothetical protein
VVSAAEVNAFIEIHRYGTIIHYNQLQLTTLKTQIVWKQSNDVLSSGRILKGVHQISRIMTLHYYEIISTIVVAHGVIFHIYNDQVLDSSYSNKRINFRILPP